MKVYYEGERIGEGYRFAHIVHELEEEEILCDKIMKSIASEVSYYNNRDCYKEATCILVDDKRDYDEFMTLWKKHKKIVKASKK